MDRIQPIMTKVRPVKKLFIIEPDDLTTFIKVIRLCSGEIMGQKNLILINDQAPQL